MRDVQLSGVFVQSFARACVNLHLLAGHELDDLLATPGDSWVSASRFVAALDLVERRFPRFEPILERIGREMMTLWYEHGPGRTIVTRGVDFLRYQTSSEGYRSVVRGDADVLGAFTLEHLDVAAGTARVRSTTPFDKTMERGVLLGGMQWVGDLVHVEVDNAADPNVYEIRFH